MQRKMVDRQQCPEDDTPVKMHKHYVTTSTSKASPITFNFAQCSSPNEDGQTCANTGITVTPSNDYLASKPNILFSENFDQVVLQEFCRHQAILSQLETRVL